MKTIRVTALALSMVWMLTACSLLQLAPAKSFDTQVDYANGMLTAVVQTTNEALSHRRIGVEKAKAFREVATQTKWLLDSAMDLGDSVEGRHDLALAIALLENLKMHLNERDQS